MQITIKQESENRPFTELDSSEEKPTKKWQNRIKRGANQSLESSIKSTKKGVQLTFTCQYAN